MTEQNQPSKDDISHMTKLLVHGHLADIYAMQKVNVNVTGISKLSLRDILLILQIGMEPGVTSSSLSILFRISSPLLSTRITALMRMGLIRQVEDGLDRRVHKLALSNDGRKIYKKWFAKIEDLASEILKTFSRSEMDEMEDHIEFILNCVYMAFAK